MLDGLAIEHAIKETDFKHIFSANPICESKNSPYMQVRDENDRILAGSDAFRLPDGTA